MNEQKLKGNAWSFNSTTSICYIIDIYKHIHISNIFITKLDPLADVKI